MRIGVSPGEIDLADRGFTDLNPVLCGDEVCPPGHNVGPGARSCYLLHYIVSGHGTLENPRGSFEVGAGKCFLIRPDELTVYRADDADPWYYIWIGLTGKLAPRLVEYGDVINIDDPTLFTTLPECRKFEKGREEFLAGKAFMLLSALRSASTGEVRRGTREAVEYAANFINQNYGERIVVEELADRLHIDRHYFSAIFRKRYGMSPKEYITMVKLDNADRLLKAGMNVTEVALMVGYRDTAGFSRIYKKRFGKAPSGRSR